MQQSRKIAAAGAALLVAAAAAGVGSAAAAGGAPKSAKLFIRGSTIYKINQYSQNTLRYAPATLTIRTGGTLTIVNKDPSEMEPHSFSLVKKSQLPRTSKQITACFMLQLPVCRAIAISHGVDPNSQTNGPPPKLIADTGQAGFDTPGDSDARLFPGFKSVTDKITAKPGTTLYYLCVIHPWMQGKIKVVK